MNGIYSIIDGKVHLHHEAVQFLPTVSQLTDPEIKYLVCVYDLIDSPIKGLPISQRRESAVSFFFPEEVDKKLKIQTIESDDEFKEAVKELKSITYDPDRATYDNYNEKLRLLNQELLEAPATKVKDVNTAIQLFSTWMADLKRKIEADDINMINLVLKGGRKPSFLERWQRTHEMISRTDGRARG